MTPRISVLMPVRDGARWLGAAVASIQEQTFADFELIIVDDGSADSTQAIIAASVRVDPRVRVLRQERLGLVAALNRGLAEARGTLIARLDADDLSAPQRLARQSDYLESHPEIGLIGSWADTINEQGAVTGTLQPEATPDALAVLLMRKNPLLHSSIMLRASVLKNVGAYRPAFQGAEDYDLWLRIAEVSKIANLPERLLSYRVHPENVTHSARVRQLFSTRLAQRAAQARRRQLPDPSAALVTPPDWLAPESLESPFYGDMARLFRFLALADAFAIVGAVDISPLSDRAIELTHAERHLAQLALLNLLKQGITLPGTSRAAWLGQFIRLHPLRALKLALKC